MRQDGIDTKILGVIDKKVFSCYLKKILKKPILKVLKDPKSYTLKNEKDTPKRVFTNLRQICDTILTSLEQNVEEIPL